MIIIYFLQCLPLKNNLICQKANSLSISICYVDLLFIDMSYVDMLYVDLY